MNKHKTKLILAWLLFALLTSNLAGCVITKEEGTYKPYTIDVEDSKITQTPQIVDITVDETPEPDTKRETAEIVYDLAVAYVNEEPQQKMDTLLYELKSRDEKLSEKWKDILTFTENVINSDGDYPEVLPDGLDETDALCIIVLGYQLKSDGSMARELIGRLKTALKSAKKYPNAMILCTGGGTAKEAKDATEAECMAKWLQKKGIDKERIIVENKSKTTVANAKYTSKVLYEEYPNVRYAAVITSDYHIPRGLVYMQTKFIQDGGDNPIRVVANAAYKTNKTWEATRWNLMKGIFEVLNDSALNRIIEKEGFRKP